MEWMPQLGIGWLNGWLPASLLLIVDLAVFANLPKDVVRRFWDRSGWERRQVLLTAIGKVVALALIVLLVLTPLKIGSPVLGVGLIIVALGFAGLAQSFRDFVTTPLGEPVTRGIYGFTRHPQNLMSSVILLGCAIATGSWVNVLLILVARAFGHANLVAEEEVCLRHYGDAYQAYLHKTRRYGLF